MKEEYGEDFKDIYHKCKFNSAIFSLFIAEDVGSLNEYKYLISSK